MKNNQISFLTSKDVANRYSIGQSTVWEWTARGKLPTPLKFGDRCTRWKSSDLDEYDQKIKEGAA